MIAHDDPRLTAYALGELDAAERGALEAELGESDALRAEVDAIRSTSTLLERELAGAAGLELRGEHKARIEEALSREGGGNEGREATAPSRTRGRYRLRWGVAAVAMAAGLCLVPLMRDRRAHDIAPTRDALFAAPTVPHDVTYPAAERIGISGLPVATQRWDAPRSATPPPAAALQPLAARPAAPALQPLVAEEPSPGWNRESYDHFGDNPFVLVRTDPRSTFSIDVDTASYALVRRFLRAGALPPKGAVRIEELVNYFSYAYPEPPASAPISITADVTRAPWASDHLLARVALKGRHIDRATRPASNLVFLVDVSGSMITPDKLPLVKQGLRLLTEVLDERDHVSIVVYAGASGLVLPPTPGNRKRDILDVLDRLEASGSTNGGGGIELAYETAARNFSKDGVNRVILATDGDFNVGVTSQSALVDLIERKAKSGVFLSVLGFGEGNYQDSTMEKLADKGNGNYAYIDSEGEARKVLVEQATGTLVTVAKDVKVQLELNPAEVEAFRLIGYENRVLAHRDFNDDTKDAGDVGADHTVTALYELVPAGGRLDGESVDDLRYQAQGTPPGEKRGELFYVKARYKLPSDTTSRLLELPVPAASAPQSDDFRFAAAVAEFGMLLRGSPHKGASSYDDVLQLAASSLGGRDTDARREFLQLVNVARSLPQP